MHPFSLTPPNYLVGVVKGRGWMEGAVEYLSEWPPPASSTRPNGDLLAAEVSSLSAATIPSESPPSPKRIKHELEYGVRLDESSCTDEADSHGEELEHQLSLAELHTVHCHYSVLADALLARWWKMMSKSEHTSQSESHDQRVVAIIKSNAEPQTQLYHISRYLSYGPGS